jgi:hypothetical protein
MRGTDDEMKIPREKTVLDSPCAFVWIDDDGILNVLNKENAEITIDLHRETYVNLRALAQGAPRPALVDLRPIRSMDKASRDYSASAEHADIMSAVALIVSSPLSRVIGNFFLGLNVPPFPVRLFSNEGRARSWLLEQ